MSKLAQNLLAFSGPTRRTVPSTGSTTKWAEMASVPCSPMPLPVSLKRPASQRWSTNRNRMSLEAVLSNKCAQHLKWGITNLFRIPPHSLIELAQFLCRAQHFQPNARNRLAAKWTTIVASPQLMAQIEQPIGGWRTAKDGLRRRPKSAVDDAQCQQAKAIRSETNSRFRNRWRTIGNRKWMRPGNRQGNWKAAMINNTYNMIHMI